MFSREGLQPLKRQAWRMQALDHHRVPETNRAEDCSTARFEGFD
jgi:hypothetical protein